MKKTPCEYIVWGVLPCIRKKLAEVLYKKGLSQKEIAEMLGVSNAAISQYLSNKRGKLGKFDDEIEREIEISAEEIIKGCDVVDEMCRICRIIKRKNKFIREPC
ncbi:MAG TPA: helix-turn-helix domain-containing protein [Thermoplasmatales archaeon]|nr:helix-turn-helix domain-containing protein [Thermoplasmatales archaeon]